MDSCPHCGQPAISFWEKLSIKLHDPAICRLCGRTATASFFKAFLTGVPFLLTFAPMPFCTPDELDPILGSVWGLLIPATWFFGLFLYLKKVPLIKVARPPMPFAFPEVGPRWSNRHDAEPPQTEIQRACDSLSENASRTPQ